jgi:hypothetical protein
MSHQLTARVTAEVGCLDKLAEPLRHSHINSAACACEGKEGFATFAVEDKDAQLLRKFNAKVIDVPVLHVNVRNEAGCLSRVLSSFSLAGASVGSLACACSPGDAMGTVAVGLLPRT